MRVIIPISLLLFAVVAPTVFRSMSSSRRLLSHYVPTLLLSFVKTPACICRHTFIHVYSFFSFYPLIASRHPLVNMIFLNSYPLARLSFVIYRHFSYSVEFHPGFSSRTGVTSLILSTIAFIPSLSLSLFPSLLCQSSSHSFVFLFSTRLFGEHLFSSFLFHRFIAPRLRAPFSIIISSLAFSTLYLLTRSSLYLLKSLNLLDTHRNHSRAEMDFHSLRVILAYDELRA